MKTIEVFGVSNERVASYIERQQVDERFIEGLRRNKHIIVFGASKQGKTALTNRHLNEGQFIRYNCSPKTQTIDIYQSILRQLKIDFQEQRVETNELEVMGRASIKAKVKIPSIIEADASPEISTKTVTENSATYKNIEYNLDLPQDISEILKSFKFEQRIIIENFHYLEEDVQKQIAFDLRVFEDYNILFIILGIWREKNRLAQFNGDLQDRIIEIPVEPWEQNDFISVINKGSQELNIKFDNELIEEIIKNSFDSIGVFQELCKECCLANSITQKVSEIKHINKDYLSRVINKKLEDYSGRHIRSLEAFIEQTTKTSDNTPLFLAYYFVKILFDLEFKDVETGLKRNSLHNKIKEIHHRPDDVRSSDISNFLNKLIPTQIKKDIVPPLFDYDRSTRNIKIIDSTLYFFLKNADKEEIINDFDIPIRN